MNEPIDYAFLHGGVQGGWVWDETIAALDSQTPGAPRRALVLDIPGCGAKRGRSTVGLGPDEVAAELIDEIVAAGLQRIVLVGHSQAGTVLPRLVELRPELFRRVVYVSFIAPLPGQTVLNFRQSGLPPLGHISDPPSDPRQRFAAIFCNDMLDDQARNFLDRLGGDAWPDLMYQASDWRYEHLEKTPASYFICLRDAVLPTQWQEVFAGRLKTSRLVRLDAGHQVMNTRPHALAEALRHEAAK